MTQIKNCGQGICKDNKNILQYSIRFERPKQLDLAEYIVDVGIMVAYLQGKQSKLLKLALGNTLYCEVVIDAIDDNPKPFLSCTKAKECKGTLLKIILYCEPQHFKSHTIMFSSLNEQSLKVQLAGRTQLL